MGKVWEVVKLDGGYYLRQYVSGKQFGRGLRTAKSLFRGLEFLILKLSEKNDNCLESMEPEISCWENRKPSYNGSIEWEKPYMAEIPVGKVRETGDGGTAHGKLWVHPGRSRELFIAEQNKKKESQEN